MLFELRPTTYSPPCQLSDVAEGLSFLHSCDIVHGALGGVRDCSKSWLATILIPIQPNILVDTAGRARITGFGLAAVTRIPDPGYGTQWIAPEILDNPGAYSKEGDVFSFAMVTIEVRCV